MNDPQPIRRAIYPGSFDPITNGHLDVAVRATRLFDEVVLAITQNQRKTPFLSIDERVQLATEAVEAIQPRKRIRVVSFSGLLVDFARTIQAHAVVRGLRAVSDFEFEFQLALMNRRLAPEIEMIFLMPRDQYVFLSSNIVREIHRLGGDVSEFVPAVVLRALNQQRQTENRSLS